VVNELPFGLPGVLIAAIYGASMGVISSGINALTTTTLIDFYQRLWRPNVEPARQLKLARWLTVMYGIIVLLLAFVIERLGTLMEASNTAIGLAGGPLLGLFLLGMLSKRANAKGAVIGWVAGFALLLPICFLPKITPAQWAAVFRLVELVPIQFLTRASSTGFKVPEISFLWYAMIGCLATMIVGWIVSMFTAPPSPKQIEGLTYDPRYIHGKEQPAQ
jgi:sodium-coupled monocarboxylate transporter 8/12